MINVEYYYDEYQSVVINSIIHESLSRSFKAFSFFSIAVIRYNRNTKISFHFIPGVDKLSMMSITLFFTTGNMSYLQTHV